MLTSRKVVAPEQEVNETVAEHFSDVGQKLTSRTFVKFKSIKLG